jgi:CBS domain-containing protein
MSVGELCNREVIVIEADASIDEAVKLMRQYHVGDIVVVRDSQQPVPAGMLTDRDLVIEVYAKGVDPASIAVGDVMSTSLITARESDDLFTVIGLMRKYGVRRLPIVNDAGWLEGIITVDDMMELLAEQVTGLVEVIRTEQQREAKYRD